MYDDWGDGWNGAAWTWRADESGEVVSSGTLNDGSSGTADLCGIVGDPSLAEFRAHVGRWFDVRHHEPSAGGGLAPRVVGDPARDVELRWLMLLTKKPRAGDAAGDAAR